MLESLVRPLRSTPADLCPALVDALLSGPGVAGALIHVLALLVVVCDGFLLAVFFMSGWLVERYRDQLIESVPHSAPSRCSAGIGLISTGNGLSFEIAEKIESVVISVRPTYCRLSRHLRALALLFLVLVTGCSPDKPPGPPDRPRLAMQSPPPIADVVAITVRGGSSEYDLAGRYYYYEDRPGKLTFDEVRKPGFQDRFRLSRKDDINLGFTDSALWLRIDLHYAGRPGPVAMLTFDYPLLDHIDIYDAASAGDGPLLRLGDRLPFAARPVPHRFYAIPLPNLGTSARRLYVRIDTQSSMQVRPAIVSGHSLFLRSNRQELAFGVVYGLMILMALYNLFLFLSLRDWSYLLFVGSTLCAMLFLMSLYGHAFQYLWPTSPAFANLASPLFASLWVATTAAFARFFLEPSYHSRAAALTIDVLIAVGVAATLVALLAHYRPAMMFVAAACAGNAMALMACGSVIWKRGKREARFFTLAWIVMGIGVLSLALSRFGILPDNFFTHQGGLLGGIAEMVLLSLALSDKYRLLHLELEGYSKGLEEMVAQRTHELEDANAKLQMLSLTDPLTGVPNRRLFDETLQTEVGRHRRIEAPLSLLMIDVDRFKDFNDRHGHQFGDECLRSVAEALSAITHRSADVVARYGGEEFVVLLPETNAAGARSTGDRILEVVRNLRLFSPDGDREVRITVSVGLTTWIPGPKDSAEQLLSVADQALYEAKRSGRDRLFSTTAPDINV